MTDQELICNFLDKNFFVKKTITGLKIINVNDTNEQHSIVSFFNLFVLIFSVYEEGDTNSVNIFLDWYRVNVESQIKFNLSLLDDEINQINLLIQWGWEKLKVSTEDVDILKRLSNTGLLTNNRFKNLVDYRSTTNRSVNYSEYRDE